MKDGFDGPVSLVQVGDTIYVMDTPLRYLLNPEWKKKTPPPFTAVRSPSAEAIAWDSTDLTGRAAAWSSSSSEQPLGDRESFAASCGNSAGEVFRSLKLLAARREAILLGLWAGLGREMLLLTHDFDRWLGLRQRRESSLERN